MQNEKNTIKEVYEDGEAEINGRVYKFSKFTHPLRLKVYSFMTTIAQDLQKGNMGFLTTDEFKPISKIIEDYITVDGIQISKRKDHWEKYPEDFLILIPTALSVISYPFLKGNLPG